MRKRRAARAVSTGARRSLTRHRVMVMSFNGINAICEIKYPLNTTACEARA